jgi:hypothetical protein
MRALAVAVGTFVILAAAPSGATAQGNLVELGLDGTVAVGLDDPRVTTIGIPIQQFRAGFFTSPTISWEPTFAMNYVRVEGLGHFSAMSLGMGVLIHLSPDRSRARSYVRPFAGVTRTSNGTSDSAGNFGFGFGLKSPFADRRLATRLEAFLNHIFDDPNSATTLGASFGLSFFTR